MLVKLQRMFQPSQCRLLELRSRILLEHQISLSSLLSLLLDLLYFRLQPVPSRLHTDFIFQLPTELCGSMCNMQQYKQHVLHKLFGRLYIHSINIKLQSCNNLHRRMHSVPIKLHSQQLKPMSTMHEYKLCKMFVNKFEYMYNMLQRKLLELKYMYCLSSGMFNLQQCPKLS